MNATRSIDNHVLEEWESKGWALVPNFVGADELVGLRNEAERLWADLSLFGARGAVPKSATRSDRLDPVTDLSELFADLARDPRLLSLVNDVLGGPPELMKDKFIAKPPGAGGYAAHQDGAYWQGFGLDFSRSLTAILFLDDSTSENGAVECSSGQHHSLLTEPGIMTDPDEEKLSSFTTIGAEAGDLLLLHALTPHRSSPNRSAAMRRTLAYSYSVDTRPNLYAIYQQFQQEVRS